MRRDVSNGHNTFLISSEEGLGDTIPIQADEWLALTLRFCATGETYKSLHFFEFREMLCPTIDIPGIDWYVYGPTS